MKRALSLLTLACSPLLAERYSFRVYGEKEGLLNPVIRGVAQDEAGYLWLSTAHGIYRFADERLEYMHPKGLTQLDVRSMLGTADGAMWFRSGGTLERYLNGQVKVVAREPIDRYRPQSLAADGRFLWLITGNGGLAKIDAKTLERQTLHGEPGGLWSLLMMKSGRLMAGCGDGVCEWTGRGWAKARVPAGHYTSLHEGRDGSLFARSAHRVLRREAGGREFVDITAALPPLLNPDQPTLALTTDFHRRVLVNTETGLARFENGVWRAIGDTEGFAQQLVRDVFVDREGGIWIATFNGLWRWLGDGAWRLFGAGEGLPRRGVESAAQARDGSVWLSGGPAGVYRGVKSGSDWRFRRVEGLPATGALITVSRDGGVWLGPHGGGILRYDPGTGKAIPVEGGDARAYVNDFSIDHEGRVVAITNRGFYREKAPNVLEPVVPGPDLFALGFAADHSLWLAGDGAIFHVDGNRVDRLTTTDEFEKRGIRAIQPDPEGRIWMGTWQLDGFRAYRRNGTRLEPTPMEIGTPGDLSTFFLRHQNNRLWAGTVRGLAALERGRWHFYGRSQGLAGDQCTYACFLKDGTIWFATSGGLAQFTPPVDQGPVAAPLTVISRVRNRLDEDLPLTGRPEVIPSANDITVDFAVLSTSLSAPPEVRYRLNDGPWAKAKQRSLQFLKMTADDYRLEIAARGTDGAWHPQPAAVSFRIQPFWWQRWWFYALLAALAALALWMAARWRMRAAQAQNQNRVREMIERYPGVVALFSPDSRFVMANRRFGKLTRIPPGRVEGRLVRDVLPAHNAANVEARLAQALRANAPIQYEDKYEVKGRPVVFDVHAFPLRKPDGEVESICAFATDVTDRWLLERERDEANQRYHSFIEQSSEAIIRIELAPPIPVDVPEKEFARLFYERAVIAEANQVDPDQVGVPLSQVLGKRFATFRDRWHPENAQMDREWYKGGFRLANHTSVVRRAPDGRDCVLVANSIGIVEDGHLTRTWSMQRDITGERRLQELISGMARGVSAETGARFFDRLAEHLARSLGALQAFVCEGERTLACWSGGQLDAGVKFDAASHAPGCCVTKPFPNGLLAVVFARPGDAGSLVPDALEVFATRAAAELERLRAERNILEYQDRLRALGARNQRLAEEQRAHLAREIHDELGQQLTAIKIGLSFLRGAVKDNPRATQDIAELAGLADETVRSVRRLSTELRPPALDQLGLAAAIRGHAKDAAARFGLEIDCRLEDIHPGGDTATAAFRIFQESLTNVARHAAARRVSVELRADGERLELVIRDDGRGLPETGGKGSLGLLGMRERAAAVGGVLVIESEPGMGTKVSARLPLNGGAGNATLEAAAP